MEVNFALLAEHVSEDRDGKLSITGIFDEIYATTAPFTYPRMFTAVRLHARVTEGSQHTVSLVIVDEDGHEVVSKSPSIPVSLAPSGPGMPMRTQVVAELVAVRFPRFGEYEFNVFIDDQTHPIASVPFSVSAMDSTG